MATKMRYHSKPIQMHRASTMMYLRGEGFHAGETRTGFCAINKSGMVITVSPLRTLIEYKDASGQMRGERFGSPQTISWFQETIDRISREVSIPWTAQI
jgi:hypothetical protein